MLSTLDAMADLEPRPLKSGGFQGKLNSRRKREFMPEDKKDASYWEKRRKNNEAAKRSREKRRFNDLVLESKMLSLNEENACLRVELLTLKLRYGLISSTVYAQEAQILQGCMQKYFARQRAIEMDPHFLELDPPFVRDGCCHNHMRYTPGRMPLDPIDSTSQHTRDSPLHTKCPSPVSVRVHKQYPLEISTDESAIHKASLNQLLYSRYPHTFNETYPYYRPSSASPNATEVDNKSNKRESEDDAEDEQQVPKMLPFSPVNNCRFEHSTTSKSSNSALPHKLRIKAKTMLAKEEKGDAEFDLEMSWKDKPGLAKTRSASLTEIRDMDVGFCGGICNYTAAFKPVIPLSICHSV
ncbi:nuclear factor interleukin-3-regulated protein-like [Scyliorhinus canicula]|uniref:nuclear factor interleukin-3-regulated protein-like n=1 Tax=Scyliorhinus canicula TaxID=7830 RepID=UPI0018F2CA46|nr:nuclear factor interleukin-3-regulated protein-like [Scyliorhinus canicula]XP_038634132.1 nuclear factor interleukin-3-regulated protein-like [Scyliorhinus canicula]